MKRILLVLILLSAPFMAEAQINELGLWAGGANYVGDVGPTNYIAPNDLAIGLLYKWNRSPLLMHVLAQTMPMQAQRVENNVITNLKTQSKSFP
jgi:hypothetical protein